MKILMVSTEAVPFAKTGGLADSVAALSTELQKNNEVVLVMPRYYSINRNGLRKVISGLAVQTYQNEVFVDVYESHLENSKVRVLFVDYEKCFGREGIYGSSYGAFKDNPYRFSVLSFAVFAICNYLGWFPDIIHAHDWAAALVPVLLKFLFRHGGFSRTASVFSIHNLGYQGIFPVGAYRLLGLSFDFLESSGFKQFNNINFLKAGIQSSEQIVTVSPSYAEEIQQESYGEGLSGLLNWRKSDLSGILNGVDLNVWNPSSDLLIPAGFNPEDLSGKRICKTELQKYFGLEINPDIPVVAFIARFATQKGINELFRPYYGCMYNMCSNIKAQFIVMGCGEDWCENEVRMISDRYSIFKCYIGYNEKISHLIEAGSDFFLMPSKYEPCGLNQMYSQVYGTVPIVHETGGLKDSVDFFGKSQNPSGFGFMDLYPDAIFNTVRFAVSVYENDRNSYDLMQKNGMLRDFTWKKSAEKYMEVYKKALEKL